MSVFNEKSKNTHQECTSSVSYAQTASLLPVLRIKRPTSAFANTLCNTTYTLYNSMIRVTSAFAGYQAALCNKSVAKRRKQSRNVRVYSTKPKRAP
jgi:hypothetical protein